MHSCDTQSVRHATNPVAAADLWDPKDAVVLDQTGPLATIGPIPTVSSWLRNDRPAGSLGGALGLVGNDVCDVTGTFLGRITDVVLEAGTIRAAYAVIGVEGFMGFGRKRFTVPWSALTADAGFDRWVLNVSKEQLTHAPLRR